MLETMPRTSGEITAALQTLHFDMEKVRAVEALIGDAATAKFSAMQDEIATEQDNLIEALAAEALEARNKLLASFSDISVDVTYPLNETGLSFASFTIRYERLTYNMSARASIPTKYTCAGFYALPDEVFDYLTEVRPEMIPAEIMQLTPGNPREAFGKYFSAKRNGYFVR